MQTKGLILFENTSYKRTKTFQSSLSRYKAVDIQRDPYCCHCFHRYRIERAHSFELLKQLHITCIFVYHTVKLFLDNEKVSNRERSGRPRLVHMPQVISSVKSRINQNPE